MRRDYGIFEPGATSASAHALAFLRSISPRRRTKARPPTWRSRPDKVLVLDRAGRPAAREQPVSKPRNTRKPDAAAPELFAELDPEPRLLMGPGPVDVYPRVLRAMSVALQGQFDPQFTSYMT